MLNKERIGAQQIIALAILGCKAPGWRLEVAPAGRGAPGVGRCRRRRRPRRWAAGRRPPRRGFSRQQQCISPAQKRRGRGIAAPAPSPPTSGVA
ncbi:hypothetical protein EKD04_006970 [Chloroflexales bacterium ZM16-3]|nr:hypothetical protein [Chloroflexales bacterium ZM16-3]